MKKTILILSLLSFPLFAKERKPQSSERVFDFFVAYRGHPAIVSDSTKVNPEAGKELAEELCKKLGAFKGQFIGIRIFDFEDRGPDWAAQWQPNEKVFKLVEKRKFLTADQLQCEFYKPVTCKPLYNSNTLFDLLHSIECE